ncbi:MAG: GAF domain-containing sensor histidine kinase [Cyanobacteria bacterium P01_F01_bin.4]
MCQSQLRLLNQAFGPISAVIYLAEASTQPEEPGFIPIASYPDALDVWPFEWQTEADSPLRPLPPSPLSATGAAPAMQADTPEANAPQADTPATMAPEAGLPEIDRQPEQQLVMPLMYTDVMVGLMVVIRHEHQWHEDERSHLQQVADGVAAGCVLDRSNHWMEQRLQDKRALQSRQSEVFHNLLHQFRNPLTALGTFGKLLQRRLTSEDPNSTIADSIVRESQRLKALVEDFDETVDLGDIELQQDLSNRQDLSDRALPPQSDPSAPALLPGLGHSLTPMPLSLPQLLEPLITVSQTVAQEKQIQLWVDIAPALTDVMADQQALQEVISNLLDNAIKYAPNGAWVWLQTGFHRTEGPCSYQGILVGDTGPGIPVADRDQLFQRYYRGAQAEGPITGTGLGLAIAHELMTQMQGGIEMFSPIRDTPWTPVRIKQSERQQHTAGPGTAFIVWIPESRSV